MTRAAYVRSRLAKDLVSLHFHLPISQTGLCGIETSLFVGIHPLMGCRMGLSSTRTTCKGRGGPSAVRTLSGSPDC